MMSLNTFIKNSLIVMLEDLCLYWFLSLILMIFVKSWIILEIKLRKAE